MTQIEKLIKENMNLVGYVAHWFPSDQRIMDELRQEGMIGLWKAAEVYDPDSGNAFATIAIPIIKNKMIDHLRKEERWNSEVIGNDDFVDAVSTGENPESQYLEEEARYNMNIKIREACGEMTDREQAVLTHRLLSKDPEGLQALAKWWGCSHESIRRDEKRLKKRIKENYDYE